MINTIPCNMAFLSPPAFCIISCLWIFKKISIKIHYTSFITFTKTFT